MPYDSTKKFFSFALMGSGLSQPCSINSPKYGGTPRDINVQILFSSLQKYQEYLPDFLLFDTSTSTRQTYTDDITCPIVKWIKPDPSAGVRFDWLSKQMCGTHT